MLLPLLILVLLVFAVPVTVIFDGPFIKGLIAATAAMSVAIIAVRIRPGEAGFLAAVIRPIAIIAAVPAIWMLIQVMPLQSLGLAHPIWKSAAAALGRPLAGTISIDPGATLISLVRYLSAIAIAFLAAAVAIDRRRAEWALFALMASTTFVALMALAINLRVFKFLTSGDGGQSGLAASAIAGLGAIFATAAALHTIERREARRPEQITLTRNWPGFSACLTALAICCLAVIVGATSQIYVAVVCGVVTLAVTVMIRRFDIGPWGIAAIISIGLLVAIAVVAFQPNSRTVGLTLAFATWAPAPLIAITQRILTETGWTGTGAGTFAVVLPIYRGIDELTSGQIAPTAAAAIAIEMGRPFFWASLMATIALMLALLRGALRRQRDSFYSAAGASCVMAVTLLSFSNPVLLSTPVWIVVAAAVGIAIVQSKSRLI